MGGTGGTLVHYTGTWSSPVSVGSSDVSGLWGTSSTDVYMVNRDGQIWHYNGTSWVLYAGLQNSDVALLAIWGSGRTDVWTVGTDFSNYQFNRVFHGTR